MEFDETFLTPSTHLKIAWYENNGDRRFTPQIIITDQADFALSVAAGDLDGDGDLDVLSASQLDGTVAWYENLPQDSAPPKFASHVVSTAAARIIRTHSADLDSDGDEDLFTADWNAGRLVWYENQDGRFVRFDFAVEVDHPAAIATADLDNDGDLDVIATSGCVPRTTEIADNVSFVDGDDTISLQIRNAHWQPQGLQCRSLPW